MVNPQVKGLFDFFYVLLYSYEIPNFNRNSVDFDQTPLSAASDLGLHCLSMSHLRGN